MKNEIKQLREEFNKKLDEIENLINEKKQILFTKIGDLEWSEDLGEMDWFKATKRCEELGGRLPTRVELIDLYDNHREECEDYSLDYTFWSSTELSWDSSYAWRVNLYYGYTYTNTKVSLYYVRCVRRCK